LFSPRCFVSWWCRRSHTPVFNKREELPRCRDWYACQYFLRNEYPDLYFGLEEKSEPMNIFCLLTSQHEKVKPKTYCVKRTLIKLALWKSYRRR
jgi:hypothetical protein